jgi:hypothetical protein
MIMIGMFHFALLPGADPTAFEQRMRGDVFTDPNALQLTRITERFHHDLARERVRRPGDDDFSNPGPAIHYVWIATVDLTTSSGYDFEENAPAIQERVAELAVLTAVDSFIRVQD